MHSAINSLESQIPSGGEAGQIWMSDGSGAGKWADGSSFKGDKGDKGDTGDAGPQGETGPAGPKGDSPVRGVDYWTALDKSEIVSEVLANIPVAEGGNY